MECDLVSEHFLEEASEPDMQGEEGNGGRGGRGQLSLSKDGLGDSRNTRAGGLEGKGGLQILCSRPFAGAGGA